jgi:imidazolonepropionase-like amidohydrolase/ketosteroid isomerase-like protein
MPAYLFLIFSFLLFNRPLFAQEQKTLVLRNLSLVALGGNTEMRGQDIFIQGDKITSIRPTGRAAPVEALVIDCTGQWALPGLIDTHVHVALRDVRWPEDEQEFVELLAGGVTTVFDLGGRLPTLQDIKKRTQTQGWIGPRVLHCGSPLFSARLAGLDSATQRFIVKNANEVKTAIRQLKIDGVDAIKIDSNVPADLTKAAIEEAHAQGLLAVGHLVATSFQEAAKARIDLLEGVSGLVTDYISAGDRKELSQRWFPAYVMAWEKVPLDRTARSKMQLLANNAVFFMPSLATELSILQTDVPARQAALAEQTAQKFAGMLRLAFDLQVPLLAGSDYGIHKNDRRTLHDELESWVAAGLEPRFAIEAATTNASHALRLSDRLGELTAGKLADIIVVNENPFSNLKTLREPSVIVRAGKLYRRDELRSRLQPHRRDERDIRAVLEQQERAWNDFDIERYMRGYWKNDSTVFASGGDIMRGWNALLSRYKKSYDTPEKMGQLKFAAPQIDFMGEGWAKVLGEWKLLPKTAKNAASPPMSRGLFTLIFQRLPEGWRIVHDHTSMASQPSPPPPQPTSQKKK